MSIDSPDYTIRAEIAQEPRKPVQLDPSFIEIENYSFFYGKKQVLKDLSLEIPERQVTAFIGPSGCGKSTLIRSLNRLNELVEGSWQQGDIRIQGQSIFSEKMEVISLRRRVGMVFQKSNPFPKSVYDNVIYGLTVSGHHRKDELDEVVERSLRSVGLWDEVKDNLYENALSLSGGQQQRLCIARAISTKPQILLMDEPCSALDPIVTGKIEELINELKKRFTIVIVTHNMQQAGRVSDKTAFFYEGMLVEYRNTEDIFLNPMNPRTEAYVSGRFG